MKQKVPSNRGRGGRGSRRGIINARRIVFGSRRLAFPASLSRKSLSAPRALFDSEQLGIRKRVERRVGEGGGGRREAESCASRDREGETVKWKTRRGREEGNLL